MEILVPTASPRGSQSLTVRPLGDLRGKRIGIVSNGWRSMEAMIPCITRRLTEQYGAREVNAFAVPLNRGITAETLEKVATECDAAIVGLAN